MAWENAEKRKWNAAISVFGQPIHIETGYFYFHWNWTESEINKYEIKSDVVFAITKNNVHEIRCFLYKNDWCLHSNGTVKIWKMKRKTEWLRRTPIKNLQHWPIANNTHFPTQCQQTLQPFFPFFSFLLFSSWIRCNAICVEDGQVYILSICFFFLENF